MIRDSLNLKWGFKALLRHYYQEHNALLNALFFKIFLSLGNKETIGKISLTIEATNSILVLVVK